MTDAKIVRGDNCEVQMGEGVFPILREIIPGRHLRVIGTGFFITRYGLFVSAAHVFSDLGDEGKQFKSRCVIPQFTSEGCHLRPIKSVSSNEVLDIAFGQADNFGSQFPGNPLMNLRGRLYFQEVKPGERLFMQAFPLNKEIHLSDAREKAIEIKGDMYEGKMLRLTREKDHPFLVLKHFQTSIDINSGASGAAVLAKQGIVGVASRGWEFADENEEPLSCVVRLVDALDMQIEGVDIPKCSWEAKQISSPRNSFSLRELITYGHVTSTT